MTEQEYKEICEEVRNSGIPVPSQQKIIDACGKQVPKKILYKEQTYGTPWLCPECEADQIKVEFFSEDGIKADGKCSYCWKCGKKLSWE